MADEDMGLFPVVDMPDMDEDDEDEYDTDFHPSVAWDAEKGDFVVDSKHRIRQSDGYEAYKAWCLKMAQTERESCLAYEEDDGVELEDAMHEEDEGAVESAIEETIEEALMVNPRTESVGNFGFLWEKDTVSVSFTVTPIEWEEFRLEVILNR